MSLKLPQGQKLLTNVSVVRIKKGKEKFEIATYPNTVIAWRTGAEKDVREVLQIDRVFRSVEQGEYAKSKDLKKAFGTDDQEAICLEILKAGEMQLSEKERGSQQETMLKEICTMVAERCINSQSKRPVTVGVVERALAELHYNVDRNKSAKKQALEAIKLLEGKFPIERLPMNLKITFPLAARAEAREKVSAIGATFDREDDRLTFSLCPHKHEQTRRAGSLTSSPRVCSGGVYVIVCKIAPDRFRDIDATVRNYQVRSPHARMRRATNKAQPQSKATRPLPRVCSRASGDDTGVTSELERGQAEGGLIEVLQLAPQHAGDSAIDSLKSLSLDSDAPATHAPLQPSTQQPAAQPSASDGVLRAATAPGVVSLFSGWSPPPCSFSGVDGCPWRQLICPCDSSWSAPASASGLQ
jgi:ribosome maturation protein SDO1